MDYRTFFFTHIVSMAVFTLCVSVLALRNRSITGMRWFAASLSAMLVKLILQGLEGRVPPVLGDMVPNELYLVASLLQLVGLHWFVLRRPFRHRWPFALVALALAVYTGMFLGRIPFSGNVINLPNMAIIIATSWMLFRHGRLPVSRVTAFILAVSACDMGYRAWLTNMRYMRPWETVHAQTDPRWLYSLAAMALFSTCMVMCFLWYLVTELSRVLAELARTDSLTGALNRRAMEEVALLETSRSIRHGHPLSMIVLDIDHFKQLNDSRGHAAGDTALQALVDQLRVVLRNNDVIARTGGEEFTILLPETPQDAGVLAAERIRQAVEKLEICFEEEPLYFTVSAGVAQFDPALGGWESMMRNADFAMYEAKEQGRNAVRAAGGNLLPLAQAASLEAV